METVWAQPDPVVEIIKFEVIVVCVCVVASMALSVLWSRREIHGYQETTMRTLLSVVLGVSIVVASGSVYGSLPSWLFVLNLFGVGFICFLAALMCPHFRTVRSFSRRWLRGGAVAAEQSEEDFENQVAKLPLRPLGRPGKEQAGSVPLSPRLGVKPSMTAISLRKLKARRDNP